MTLTLPPAQPPPPFAGRYRLGPLLGQGSSGSVYHAEDLLGHRKIALKLLRPMAEEEQIRTQREVAALSYLKLPGVVGLLDHGEAEGRYYLTMELVEGSPFPKGNWKDLATPTLSLLATLAILHQEGIVHRDIKPENVRVRPDGSTVLLDFGLARRPGKEATVIQGPVGTPRYLAPEQITGIFLDGRADVYSVGVMLYEALAGQPPFAELGAEELMAAHLHRRILPLSEHGMVPDRVAEVVDRMLIRDWSQRPRAWEVLELLRAEPSTGAEDPQLSSIIARLQQGAQLWLWGPPASRPRLILEQVAQKLPACRWLPAAALPYRSLGYLFPLPEDADPQDP